MALKKNIFVKRIIILTLIVFSLLVSTAFIFVYQRSLNMDTQHIRVISLSAELENDILKTQILIDNLRLGNDTITLEDLQINLDKVYGGLEKLNVIFSNEFKKVDNNDLNDFSKEYKVISAKFSALNECVINNKFSYEVSESILFTAYSDFRTSYRQFGHHLQRYLFDNTILYKREIFIVFVVIFLMVLLAGYLIIHLFNQLILADRKLTLKTVEVENRERQRIAADLHDGLGAYLSAMIMHIQVLEKEYEEDPTLREKIKYLNKLTRQSHQSVEEVINNLNPSLLSRLGLIKTIEKSILKVNSLNKTQFSLDSSNLNTKICPNTEIILYRICTELINNALKHSEAKKAEFSLFNSKNKIHLKYEDNGIGFLIEESIYEIEKTGLYNLSNRVESVDGSFQINSEPDKGLHIKISLNLI